MKRFNIKGTILACLAVFLMQSLLAGCFSGLEPQSSGIPAGKGAVAISIAGSNARTIFPDMSGLGFTAVFTSGDKTFRFGVNTTDSTIATLEPGVWNLSIEASTGTAGVDRVVVGLASVPNVNVVAGQTTECKNIMVQPVTTGLPNGDLSWTVDFPDGLDSATLYVKAAGASSNAEEVDMLQVAANSGTTIHQGDISLAPGSYAVWAVLGKDIYTAGDAEAVHIYSGQTSAVNWKYYDTSFTATKALAGSIDITPSTSVTVSGVSLNLDGLAPIALSSSGNTWSFDDHIPEALNTLNGSLVISTANNAITIPVAEAYVDNMAFAPVSINALALAVGTNGTLKINDAAYTGIAQVDVINDGTMYTLNALPNGGYALDALQVNGVDYHAPFAVTADTAVTVSFVKAATNTIWQWTNAAYPWTSLTAANSPRLTPGTGIMEQISVTAKNGQLGVAAGGTGVLLGPGTGTANCFMILGSAGAVTTTNAVYDPNAEFDFSRPVTITVEVTKLNPLAASGFRMQINNDASNDPATIYGTNAMLRILDSDFTSDTMTFTWDVDLPNTALTSQAVAAGVDKDDAMKHSFISFTVVSPDQVVISSIKVEYK